MVSSRESTRCCAEDKRLSPGPVLALPYPTLVSIRWHAQRSSRRGDKDGERGSEREREQERERERDFDAVDAESDFEPFDNATNYNGEEDCAEAFDDQGLSARYFDQE